MKPKYLRHDEKNVEITVPEYIKLIKEVNRNGGPNISDYEYLKKITNKLNELPRKTLAEDMELYEALSPGYDLNSMVGFSFLKPHGYAGDFELIDRIYSKWKSDNKDHHKWDDLYHDMEATRAVRNRKYYFLNLLKNLNHDESNNYVLNLGSGPCSDLYYYFTQYPRTKIQFDCIDMDINAIDYASSVCDNYYDKVNFINKNAFRYKTERRYKLIWSAGLFDYFSDKLFIRLTNRMYQLLQEGGELVIGNFSTNNPSRGLMEVILQWYLHHRSEEELIELAISAGVQRKDIDVKSEETGVNLFLHLKK